MNHRLSHVHRCIFRGDGRGAGFELNHHDRRHTHLGQDQTDRWLIDPRQHHIRTLHDAPTVIECQVRGVYALRLQESAEPGLQTLATG